MKNIFACLLLFSTLLFSATSQAQYEPQIITPETGSTIQWTEDSYANYYEVQVGSFEGGEDYGSSGELLIGTLSYTPPVSPPEGSTVYVKLSWEVTEYDEVEGYYSYLRSTTATYTAVAVPPVTEPAIAWPAPGSTLEGTSSVFSWDSGGSDVTEWMIFIGSEVGYNDIDKTPEPLKNTISATRLNLPTDGSTVHVTLWYKINGTWKAVGYEYISQRGRIMEAD